MIELLVEFIQSICLSARFIAGDGFETIFEIYLVLDHLEKRLAQRLRHTDPVDVRIILDEGLLLGGHPERYGHNVVLLCITFKDYGINSRTWNEISRIRKMKVDGSWKQVSELVRTNCRQGHRGV